MYELSLPCHACGFDNPISSTNCTNPRCQALLRLHLRPTSTTQCLSITSDKIKETGEELIREAFFAVALLTQSINRLRALIDAAETRHTR